MNALGTLAAKKRLPVAFLQSLGLRSVGQATDIPYFTRQGNFVAYKRRNSDGSKDRFWWAPGVQSKPALLPYGEQFLDPTVQTILFITESESDVWTILYHGFPGLALPGGSFALLKDHHVSNCTCIYVLEHSDQAGRRFTLNVRKHLTDLGWNREVRRITFPDDKDVSDLHIRTGEGFTTEFLRLVDHASKVADIPSPSKPSPTPYHPATYSHLHGDGRDKIALAKSILNIFHLWRMFGYEGEPKKSCRSPFRKDQKPSFSVFADGHRWRDFGSGEGGDAIDFLGKAEGLSNRDAIRRFLNLAGIN